MDSFEQHSLTEKGVPRDTFSRKERLRDEARSRTIVVVRIANMVRVELDLAVIEVEVRRVVEADIRVRLLPLSVRDTEARTSFLLATRYALAPEFYFATPFGSQ